LRWLEISISVDGELTEPVAELFARYAHGGVAIEAPRLEDDASDAEASHTVKAYLAQDDTLGTLREAIETGLWHLSQIRPLPQATFTELDAQDWEDAWREKYHPIPIGDSLLILPPWYEQDTPGRHPLIIEPGMAFGTGTHPSTQLCLLLLEAHMHPGGCVIDLGCGSGILSIAAARLGAEMAFALDIDPEAVKITQQNAQRNLVADRVRAFHGSLEAVPGILAEYGGSPTALIVVNILAPVLQGMLKSGLGDLVQGDTPLILSGILEEQLPDLLKEAAGWGLTYSEIRGQGEWRAVVLKKE